MKNSNYEDKPIEEQIRIAEMQFMTSEFFQKIDKAIKELEKDNVNPLRKVKKQLLTSIENTIEATQNENIELVEGFPLFLPVFKSQLKEIIEDDFFIRLNDEGRFLDLKKIIDSALRIGGGEEDSTELESKAETNKQFHFKNKLIPRLEEEDIYSFFMKELLERRIKCLDEQRLQKWLKNAFEVMEESKPKITFSNLPSKSYIRSIFFEFYSIYKKRGEKKLFVKLLSDHFAGFEYDNTFNNFKFEHTNRK